MSLCVTGTVNEDAVVIRLEGRVDSNSAAEAEAKIFEEIAKCHKLPVVLDAGKLEYISSAGLRVLLKIKKEHEDFSIQNVNNDVYEIFEMTGFTDIMKITRRIREFSVDGCKLIGQGGFGKVYRYDPETVIKVYRPEADKAYIERERQCSRIAFTRGLPTAIAFDVVRVGDAYGVMYELMDADNLASVILENPDKEDEYVKKYADLAKKIHSTELDPGTLQPVSEALRSPMRWLKNYLTEDEIRLYDSYIDLLPQRNTMIHGDFHEKNVLVRNEELELIDMGDISQGHPVIEIAFAYSSHMVLAEKVIGMSAEKGKEIWEKFLHDYFGEIKPEVRERLDRVFVWIAAVRRLPFMCMTAETVPGKDLGDFIEKTKQEIFVDTDVLREDFEVLDAELFSGK